jgi:AraC-like DNA-binding protein
MYFEIQPFSGMLPAMPILNKQSPATDFVDPSDVPRPVVAYGMLMEDVGELELDVHQHRQGQLMLVMRGVISCEVQGGLWIVPPHSAIWMPCDVLHSIKAVGPMEGYNLFIEPELTTTLPATCCALTATALLRELLIRVASYPALYPEGGRESRTIALLLEELAMAPSDNLHLPMPTDRRLRKIAQLLTKNPADRSTMAVWAKRAGLSERTLARMLKQQTGMSFGRWRQQLSLMLALQWLAAGTSIQQVSVDLGYESAGSFVTMFRKALGTSPGRYMAERRGAPIDSAGALGSE